MCYTLWESGCTHSIDPYIKLYTEYKPLGNGDNTEGNGLGGIINHKGICTIVLDLEYDTVKLQNIIFEQVYYFPGASKILTIPKKWARDRRKYEVVREGICLKVMGK